MQGRTVTVSLVKLLPRDTLAHCRSSRRRRRWWRRWWGNRRCRGRLTLRRQQGGKAAAEVVCVRACVAAEEQTSRLAHAADLTPHEGGYGTLRGGVTLRGDYYTLRDDERNGRS